MDINTDIIPNPELSIPDITLDTQAKLPSKPLSKAQIKSTGIQSNKQLKEQIVGEKLQHRGTLVDNANKESDNITSEEREVDEDDIVKLECLKPCVYAKWNLSSVPMSHEGVNNFQVLNNIKVEEDGFSTSYDNNVCETSQVMEDLPNFAFAKPYMTSTPVKDKINTREMHGHLPAFADDTFSEQQQQATSDLPQIPVPIVWTKEQGKSELLSQRKYVIASRKNVNYPVDSMAPTAEFCVNGVPMPFGGHVKQMNVPYSESKSVIIKPKAVYPASRYETTSTKSARLFHNALPTRRVCTKPYKFQQNHSSLKSTRADSIRSALSTQKDKSLSRPSRASIFHNALPTIGSGKPSDSNTTEQPLSKTTQQPLSSTIQQPLPTMTILQRDQLLQSRLKKLEYLGHQAKAHELSKFYNTEVALLVENCKRDMAMNDSDKEWYTKAVNSYYSYQHHRLMNEIEKLLTVIEAGESMTQSQYNVSSNTNIIHEHYPLHLRAQTTFAQYPAMYYTNVPHLSGVQSAYSDYVYRSNPGPYSVAANSSQYITQPKGSLVQSFKDYVEVRQPKRRYEADDGENDTSIVSKRLCI